MADRGFTIADLLDTKGVSLNIPPIKVGEQLSDTELVATRRIAALNEEAGYKRARPGRKQCLFLPHPSHEPIWLYNKKIRELSCHAMACRQWRQLFYT